MDPLLTKIALTIAGALVLACAGLFVRMRKAEAVAGVLEQRVAAVESRDPGTAPLRSRVAAAETEIAAMKATLDALPTAREFAKLDRCVSETQGDVKAVAATVQGMEAMIKGLSGQVTSLNDHLIRKASG